MEKITDLFKDIKDRLNNPFFSSFLISWVIINWKILLVLIFYKQSDLKSDYYLSYLDFIEVNGSWWRCFWAPTLSGLTYTFIFPAFRNVILATSAWYKTWGTDWNLKISKAGQVPVTKYISLRKKYQDRTLELVNVIKGENDIVLKNAELTTRNETLQLALSEKDYEFKQQLSDLSKINSIERIIGKWHIVMSLVHNNSPYRVSSVDVFISKKSIVIFSDQISILNFTVLSSLGNSNYIALILEDENEEEAFRKEMWFVSIQNDNELWIDNNKKDHFKVEKVKE
jgi:hypothetical protein